MIIFCLIVFNEGARLCPSASSRILGEISVNDRGGVCMAFAYDIRVSSFRSRPLSRPIQLFSLAVLLAFLAGIPAAGQYTTASLGGTVEDPAGAVVPDATVTVQNEGTGLTRTVMTQANGTFLFPALTIGNYKLTVTKQGFTTYVQTGIVLTVNQAATQAVSVQVGAVT